jgi:uncharacterized NAD-dependent epimerase/dehydratase family protein
MLTTLKTPYLLFLGDAPSLSEAKTAAGIAYWRRNHCCGQFRLPGCKADIGLPDLTLEAAVAAGAQSLIIGVAPMGGVIQPHWIATIRAAAEAGLDIVSGLHTKLASIPGLAELAAAHGARLIDVRVPPPDITVASGARRRGLRLLTVGTDCAVGKKYTALAIDRALRERGVKSTFRATGQTGIMISGSGIPIDAVICDFVAGAAETLSPANDTDHWDVVEGQGSLFHPSYAGVTLGLLHGTQPDALVLCHDLSRLAIDDVEGFPIPPFATCIRRYVEAARLTNANVRCIGIAVNASNLADAEYERQRAAIESETGLPCSDPIRSGVEVLVAALINFSGPAGAIP